MITAIWQKRAPSISLAMSSLSSSLCAQAEVRARQGNTKAAVAAYERAVAEAPAESAALLSGLARALTSDGRASVSSLSLLGYNRFSGVHWSVLLLRPQQRVQRCCQALRGRSPATAEPA